MDKGIKEYKILMVCLGNICRSPIAEGVLKYYSDKENLKLFVDSAGTNGFHNGESPHKNSQKVCKLNGIDISNQKSRRINKSDMDKFDVVYIMDSEVLDELTCLVDIDKYEKKIRFLMNEVEPNTNKGVFDPYYGGEDGFHEVFKMIDSACKCIVNKIKENNYEV